MAESITNTSETFKYRLLSALEKADKSLPPSERFALGVREFLVSQEGSTEKIDFSQLDLAGIKATFEATVVGTGYDRAIRAALGFSYTDNSFVSQLKSAVSSFDTRTSDSFRFYPLTGDSLAEYESYYAGLSEEEKKKQPTPAQVRRDGGYSVEDLSIDSDVVVFTDSDKYKAIAYEDTKTRNVESDPVSRVNLTTIRRYDDEDRTDKDHPVHVVGLKVYIQGVDVSDYLKGQVESKKDSVQGFNTLTFTLDNSFNRFTWSERNLARLYNRDFFYDDVDGSRRTLDANTPSFTMHEDAKRKVFDVKADGKVNPPIRTARNTIIYPRFDLTPHGVCFSRMDPIRVWSVYPYRPLSGDAQQDLWIPEFTGFVWNTSVEDDDVAGTSTITIECVDIRQALLQRMRISSDPNLGLGNALDFMGFPPLGVFNRPGQAQNAAAESSLAQRARDEFAAANARVFNPQTTQFYDDIVNSEYGQLFPKKNFTDSIIELLVFKPDRVRLGQASRGVRDVQLGGTFSYPSRAPKSDAKKFLEDYHTFCLFGPKRRPWTTEEVDKVGLGTRTFAPGDPNRFGEYYPGKCRLWFLLPEEGTGPRRIADLSNPGISPQNQVNYTTRLEVLRNFVESIDYQMIVTGCGDIHVEFPMADFRPEDFGDWRDTFRMRRGLINSGYSDEAEDPVSGVAVQIGLGIGAGSKEGAASVLTTVYAYSPMIAARYGVAVDNPVSIPFLTRQENDLPIAQQRAVTLLQKANARVHALNINSAYRPFLLPNRPVHHVKRARMGNIVTVSSSFTIGLDTKAQTTVGLEHIRKWTGYYRAAEDLTAVGSQKDPRFLEWQERQSSIDATSMFAFEDETISKDALSSVGAQVYQTVMAGESLPVGSRYGWGPDAVLAPGSGVYVLSPQNFTPDRGREKPVVTATPAEDGSAETVTEPSVDTSVDEDATTVFLPPLDTLDVSSRYGVTRTKDDGTEVQHEGVDYRAATGTPTKAVADGKVVKYGYTSLNGNFVVLVAKQGNDTYRFTYLHLDSISIPGMTKVFSGAGTKDEIITSSVDIKAGAVIGTVGNTGRSKGAHLHFEARKNGSLVDPDPLVNPARRRRE